MPIASGAIGHPGVLGIPGAAARRGIGIEGSSVRPLRKFRSVPLATSNPVLTGTTRDSADAPLPGCVVKLFRTVDDVFMAQTTSDGAGAFTIHALGSGPFYLVAYLAGGTDVAGTTVNTLSAD